MSVKKLVRRWESQSEADSSRPNSINKRQSWFECSSDRNSLNLSFVIDENEAKNDEFDAPQEIAIDRDEMEAEYMSLTLAKAALEDLINSLDEKTRSNRDSMEKMRLSQDFTKDDQKISDDLEQPLRDDPKFSDDLEQTLDDVLKISDDLEQTLKDELKISDDLEQTPKTNGQLEQTPEEMLDEIIELASKSTDEEIRQKIPSKLEKIKEVIKKNPPKMAPPVPVLPPPPPPPPLPPPNMLRASSIKLNIRKKGKETDEKIKLEIPVKKSPMMDLMAQLKTKLQQRKNRDSLDLRYGTL